MIRATASNITAPTQFRQVGTETYAYRRFGNISLRPLLFLQHFMGTLDNWDFAVTDPLASERSAFAEWDQFTAERFAHLKNIHQPTLVVNGIHDEMIPVSNSYWLSQKLPNAVLMTYPDSGHGSLFQFHESFTRQAAAFSSSDSPNAPY